MSIPTSPNPTPTATPLDHPMNDPSSSTSPKLPVSLKMLSTLYTGKIDLAIKSNFNLHFIQVERQKPRICLYKLYCFYLFSNSAYVSILPQHGSARKTSSSSTTSKAGEAIIKSILNSSVVYPNLEIKYEIFEFYGYATSTTTGQPGGDEQDKITTTTNPTVPAATPNTSCLFSFLVNGIGIAMVLVLFFSNPIGTGYSVWSSGIYDR
ncbi:hypothetical protein BYT27DRAFT_7215917 [Phlegmacium glaucopus]|nr:hypothetical protein BYT27DRAFT_7215917 [Phlegmacium glaucopus]